MVQLYIIWNTFALAVGAMEARVHHWRGTDIGNDKWIHTFYWSVRAVVCLGLCSIIWTYPVQNTYTDFQATILFIPLCLMSFPFFHNGAQYTARRLMDKRLDYHWFSMSTDTNAKVNFGGVWRTVLFAGSLLGLYYMR